MTKRLLALLLCVCLISSVLVACQVQDGNDNQNHNLVTQATTKLATDTNSFKLSYSQSDSLNPFESKTLNNQIVQNLVFESLFVLDEGFNAEPSLATGYIYDDSKTLTVNIALGRKFSDGSDLTAKNIVDSFYLAKKSPRWKNSLKAFSSVEEVSSSQVKFRLSYSNPNAHQLLTFAIAKAEPDKKGYPIGSGRYKFNEGDGDVFVEVNKEYPDFSPHFTRIKLINITASESIDNAINIGNISYAFRDLAEGSKTRIQSNKKAVNMNNLVFIGINSNVGITVNKNIRRAISLAVDRSLLVKSAYQGYGKSATSVFNPASRLGRSTAVFSSTADTAASKQAIAQSGYDSKDLKIDILVNENPNKLSVAKLVKQELENVGFSVTINSVNAKAYMVNIKKRAFNVYIGETKLPDDMCLYSFFNDKGATRYGIDLKNSNSKKTYEQYMNGEGEIGKFVLEFSQEMPFVPLLYRRGMICYSKSMHGDMQGYVGNYFSNIEDWYY